MIDTIIRDNTILATEDGKVVGKIEFELSAQTMSILHTYSYESGRGIGSLLMRAAVDWAAQHHYTIHPICSFAVHYLAKKEGKK